MVGSTNRDIRQTVEQIDSQLKKARLLEILTEYLSNNPPIVSPLKGEIYTQKTLVFLETVNRVKNVNQFLDDNELPIACIHGQIDQSGREQIIEDFRSGFRPILIATAIAARGLDIVGVDHVINYDLPKNIDEYVQKIGRTGRIGNVGRATSFYDAKRDSKIARYVVKILMEAQQEVPDFLQSLVRYIGNTGIGKSGSKMENNWE